MARPLRVEFAGALYHVTSRGDGGEDIFRDERDRRMLLGVFARVVSHMRWCCHAYCLMGNHYHLLMETPEPNLARGMRQLNGIYTQRFNRRHFRTGHVFQGRYHAILVDRDSYFLEAARYVVLNPVRAGLADSPRRWAWSSYRATAGLELPAPWLTVGKLLEQFGETPARAQSAYVKFVHQGKELPSIWAALRQQIYLGGEDFVERVLDKVPAKQLPEIPNAQKRVIRPLTWYQVRYGNGASAMSKAYLSGDHTLAAIARHFGVHYSTVSRAAKNVAEARLR
ncbi:MAG: transposase [Betaproteobacteria bacterium]|nr:transposase [Betaproteobacteria bacterium]